jgi:hypothetical protein
MYCLEPKIIFQILSSVIFQPFVYKVFSKVNTTATRNGWKNPNLTPNINSEILKINYVDDFFKKAEKDKDKEDTDSSTVLLTYSDNRSKTNLLGNYHLTKLN